MADYTAMSPGQMHTALGADAMRWTDALYQFYPALNVDRETMFGWVCNMIMAGHDDALGGGPINGDHAAFLLGLDG